MNDESWKQRVIRLLKSVIGHNRLARGRDLVIVGDIVSMWMNHSDEFS